ncbi:MAG: hypothetical protein LBK12_07360 [Odoribacteraceae bacterium]|jgi:hypothetical protein|nr:hypothetical protein [Odoribacteraceae bacterium]
MNIEKIKNYNQKVLAVVGTLGIILLLICITLMMTEFHAFRGSPYPNSPSGLISNEKAENLNQENLRKQIISYESPWLIDTLESVYIIPVSITTLKKPEEVMLTGNVSSETLTLLDLYPDKMSRGYGHESSYANLILYYPLKNKTISLFNERLVLGNVRVRYFNDDILLLFYVAEKDTDKNGHIDMEDTRNLGIYSLNTGVMKKISDSENSVNHYQFVENTKDLLVEFNLNRYTEKQFTGKQMPSKIMKYQYDLRQLVEVIPQKIEEDMQKLVEGR